jgi:phage terminase large subunit GpA-like protein
MAGSQVGKTEAINNAIGYIIHHVPGPVLFVEPTVDIARAESKQRLSPMIEETPALRTQRRGSVACRRDFSSWTR